jgi:tetratricopeptide (TPR) repeat protein
VRTRLEEAGLQRLAAATNGVYVRSTSLDANLAPVQRRVEQLVPTDTREGTQKRPVERFQIPLAAGLLLLVLRLLLGERRRATGQGPAGGAARLALLTLLATIGVSAAATGPDTPPPAHAEPPPAHVRTPAAADPAAQDALRAEIGSLEAALARRPRPPEEARLRYHLALAHQRLGDPERAIPEYERALATPGAPPAVRAAACQNLGAARHLQARALLVAGKPEEAIPRLQAVQPLYRESMLLAPGLADAAHNQEVLQLDLELARQAAEQMKQMQSRMDQARRDAEAALAAQQQANATRDAGAQSGQQEQALEATERAQASAEALAEEAAARAGGQPPEPLRQATQELAQARSAQEQAASGPRRPEARQELGERAERHLANALRHLGGKPADGEPSAGEQAGHGEQPPAGTEGDPAGGEPPPAAAPPEAAPRQATGDTPPTPASAGDETPLDPRQAAAVLGQIRQEEQELRDALKMRLRSSRIEEVEKDW